MVFRIVCIDPRDNSESVIDNGITHRPASWPTREAAEAQAQDWERHRTFNSLRDPWSYRFEVREHAREES